MYLDTVDNLADSLFNSNRVRVKFGREYHKKGTKWKYIFCKVHKEDIDKFKKAMSELPNKALLYGIPDYDKAVKHMNKLCNSDK